MSGTFLGIPGTIIDLFTANWLPPAVFNPVFGAAHAHHLAGILGRKSCAMIWVWPQS
jgi:hypothetical protein